MSAVQAEVPAKPMRLAILTSHPIQYYAPIFRALAQHVDLQVFYAHQVTPEQQAQAGFSEAFAWDIDLTSGFRSSFLRNVSGEPSTSRFAGCDTPDVTHALATGRFTAVLTLGWHLKSLVQGIWAAKQLGIPVCVRGDSQLDTPRSGLKKIGKAVIYPVLLRAFDTALFVGQKNKAYFEHYNYPQERLFSSPHCIDTHRFDEGATPTARTTLRARHGIGPEEKVVLFAGKLLPFKRPLDVIDALGVLKSRGQKLRLMVAGSGPLEADVRRRREQLGVDMTFLGFQNQSEMPVAYAASDVLVLPSDGRETWGLVCNEALASGLPIVVSDQIGCAPDLAADNNVGRTFPMADIAALADAITATLANPPSPQEIKRVSDAHSILKACDGIMSALAFAISAKRVSRSRAI